MRVSDLVKDVIFLVGSMECFSQVTSVLIHNRRFVFCLLNSTLKDVLCLFTVIFYVKRREPFLGGDGGCSLYYGGDR